MEGRGNPAQSGTSGHDWFSAFALTFNPGASVWLTWKLLRPVLLSRVGQQLLERIDCFLSFRKLSHSLITSRF